MQKVKGVKVTRKVKIVKRKFCIKKTQTFTIIAMNYVQEQLNSFEKSARGNKISRVANFSHSSLHQRCDKSRKALHVHPDLNTLPKNTDKKAPPIILLES